MTVKENFSLANVLWYQIGGPARWYIESVSVEDTLEAIDFIQKNNIEKYIVIGYGSNLLFSDNGYNGLVLQLRSQDKSHIRVTNENMIHAFAGELLDDVIMVGFKNNMVGLEWAGGLPGSVGGALRGNVGAFGGDMQQAFGHADVVKLEQHQRESLQLQPDDMDFGYRTSIVKTQGTYIILAVDFALKKVDAAALSEAKKVYEQNIAYRKEKHPLDYPSCGSTFKNITDQAQVERIIQIYPEITETVKTSWHGKVSMGYLIDKLGFSGYQVGQAQVSAKHPNFIVNLGGAKASDVLAIVQAIIFTFNQKFGFSPELEMGIVE